MPGRGIALLLLAVAPALAPLAGRADAPPLAVDAPLSRTSIRLSLSGSVDAIRDPDEHVRSGTVGVRAETTLASGATVDGQGARAWGILAGAEARMFGTNLAGISGDATFYRLGLSTGVFYRAPDRNLYTIRLGAFVAEQGALLDDPQVHPWILGLATARPGETVTLLYGAGYTYTFGRGLPLPFVGVVWRWAPGWRLVALVPALVRVDHDVARDLSVAAVLGVSGDLARYRSSIAPADASIQVLRMRRARLGVAARWAFAHPWSVGAGIGVEGASIDDGLSTRRGGGAYAQLGVGWGSSELGPWSLAEGDALP